MKFVPLDLDDQHLKQHKKYKLILGEFLSGKKTFSHKYGTFLAHILNYCIENDINFILEKTKKGYWVQIKND